MEDNKIKEANETVRETGLPVGDTNSKTEVGPTVEAGTGQAGDDRRATRAAKRAARQEAKDAKQSVGSGDGGGYIAPHTQVGRPDPNKTEGGVAIDVMVTNLITRWRAYRDECRRRKFQQGAFSGKEGVPMEASQMTDWTKEKLTPFLQGLAAQGVDLTALYRTGDADRLIAGKMTANNYTLHEPGKRPRDGQLFLHDGKIHCAMTMSQESVLKAFSQYHLTDDQIARLDSQGYVVTDADLIQYNTASKRLRSTPLADIRVPEKWRNHPISAEEQEVLKRGGTIQVEMPNKKSVFLSFNPIRSVIMLDRLNKKHLSLAPKRQQDKLPTKITGRSQGREMGQNVGETAADQTVKTTLEHNVVKEDGMVEKKTQTVEVKQEVTLDEKKQKHVQTKIKL